MLGHASVERLFCFSYRQFSTVLVALYRIDHVAKLVLWCLVLRVNQFLSKSVGWLKIYWDIMFGEDPPEFLRYSRDVRNDNTLSFLAVLFFSGVVFLFRGFDEGPVGVATGLQGSPDVILFLLLALCPGWNILSSMI